MCGCKIFGSRIVLLACCRCCHTKQPLLDTDPAAEESRLQEAIWLKGFVSSKFFRGTGFI